MTHALKTWPELYAALADGTKTADVRKNDRGFQVGDDVIFQEYDNKEKKYTGNEVKSTVTHILAGDQFGIGKHFCVLSFARIEPAGATYQEVRLVRHEETGSLRIAPVQETAAPVAELTPAIEVKEEIKQTNTALPL